MSGASQTGFDFGLPETQRPRQEPWMPADARREAHARQTPSRKERMWERIMEYAASHPEGFTADQLAADWHCSPNHTAPRCTELLQLGRLRMTGEKRRTRSSYLAAVLRVNNG